MTDLEVGKIGERKPPFYSNTCWYFAFHFAFVLVISCLHIFLSSCLLFIFLILFFFLFFMVIFPDIILFFYQCINVLSASLRAKVTIRLQTLSTFPSSSITFSSLQQSRFIFLCDTYQLWLCILLDILLLTRQTNIHDSSKRLKWGPQVKMIA